MTKQERDQKNLKKNVKWLLENIDKYIETVPRPNYLMCVNISCRPGTFIFEYGTDSVVAYNKDIKKLIVHNIVNKKTNHTTMSFDESKTKTNKRKK